MGDADNANQANGGLHARRFRFYSLVAYSLAPMPRDADSTEQGRLVLMGSMRAGMIKSIRLSLALVVASFNVASTADAKYPILTQMTKRADGPYQPEVRRYVVVDPIAPRTPAYGDLHAAGHPPHGAPHASQELWRRHDLATPVYPYGWFGARPANSRSTRGSYYEDYENVTIFRGR